MEKPITGSCLCGGVTYECTAEQVVGGHCHCVDCRKTGSAGHASHMGVPRAAFTLTGKTSVYSAPTDSGNTVSRHFCPTCGASVYSTNSAMEDLVFLQASCLDDPEVFTPGVVVYTKSRPSWDRVGEGLPSFEGMPDMQAVIEDS